MLVKKEHYLCQSTVWNNKDEIRKKNVSFALNTWSIIHVVVITNIIYISE